MTDIYGYGYIGHPIKFSKKKENTYFFYKKLGNRAKYKKISIEVLKDIFFYAAYCRGNTFNQKLN